MAGSKIGVERAVTVVEFLQQRGEEGAHYSELCERFNIADSDEQLGWLIGKLRREGFLVQMEKGVASILPEAPVRTGMWLRHPEHGIVQVSWARDGFPLVKVRKLGTVYELGNEFRVNRADLIGR